MDLTINTFNKYISNDLTFCQIKSILIIISFSSLIVLLRKYVKALLCDLIQEEVTLSKRQSLLTSWRQRRERFCCNVATYDCI